MKKKEIITYIIILVAAILITLFIFEGMSFYKIGTIPSGNTFIGFVLCLILVFAIIYFIVKLLNKLKK